MADTPTPLQWLDALEKQLAARQPGMELMDAYYRGEHPLPFLTRSHKNKMNSEFSRLLEESRSNFMRLVVDATEERLGVEGFRLSASGDETADKGAWDIWQANQMDAQSQTAFLEAIVKGVSYLSVWGDEDGDGYPDIAVEDPTQTVVAYTPGSNYRRRDAALKIWMDNWTGTKRANVYLPDGIYKFRAVDATRRLTGMRESPARPEENWIELVDEFAPNPLGVVPIVPIRNRPRLLTEGESEVSDVIPIQNQINGFLFLLGLAGYFGAHRQRWVVGLKIFEDQNGKPIEPFDIAVDRLLQAEDPNAKFGEFNQTSLNGYIDSIEQKVLHIAVTTRTPRHYLIQQGQSPSGDAIESAETGLVKKVERKQRTFGEGLEEALRLARRFGGEGESPPDSEVVWTDAKMRTEGTVTDAVIKEFGAGLITRSAALAKLGYSQTQIVRMLEAGPDEFAPPPTAQINA